eukprot:13893648-Ditylum_brightwellii.AAC.1
MTRIHLSTWIVLLLAGNGLAFSPSSYSSSSSSSLLSKVNIVKKRTWKRSSNSLYSAKSQFDDYDYDKLMNTSVEKGRFDANYVRFDNDKWLAHRASDRFYRSLLDFKISPMIESLLDEIVLLMGISVIIILWNELLVDGYTDLNGLHHEAMFAESALAPNFRLALPIEPFLISGGPL